MVLRLLLMALRLLLLLALRLLLLLLMALRLMALRLLLLVPPVVPPLAPAMPVLPIRPSAWLQRHWLKFGSETRMNARAKTVGGNDDGDGDETTTPPSDILVWSEKSDII